MIPQVKEKENSFNYCGGFLWDFVKVSFQSGISHQWSMGSTYWAITEHTHSGIVTLYPKDFNQYHSYMHINIVTEYVK